jgi:hypothetical protein
MSEPSEKSAGSSAIPDDDLRREVVVARPGTDASLERVAGVGIRTRSRCGARYGGELLSD